MSSEELSSAPIEFVVAESQADVRFDWFLAQQFPRYSRTYLRQVINAAAAKVDGKRVKASHRVRAGERITVVLPELPREGPEPADIPLEILYEDAALAAINKPPGMVVHPGKGNWRGTLASALQFHFDRLSTVGGPTRPGIVHRLDRDTSGVIVVAKNDRAHKALADQFEARTVVKEYFAIVVGRPDRDRDVINLPIGFHPNQREKMAIRPGDPASRPAQSFYEVIERFDGFSAVRVLPKTGRTHQIRVHLAAIGCPVLCDRAYGGRARLTLGDVRRAPENDELLLDRQALHARRLLLKHPDTGQPLELVAPLPSDLTRVLEELHTWRAVCDNKLA
ncbi:MAG TPA: RluA family pseudouridine synthase [Pirellulales bacterium]|jgi:23S rRNA pseudouridine1911/1915/1917 synthase|nr:RluA family pseudouridine synthase [Pirellulales bacterium]